MGVFIPELADTRTNDRATDRQWTMTVHPDPGTSHGRFMGSTTNCMRRPSMTLYNATKALIAIAALVGLAACHAGFGIG
jgi:hypothetical protein